MKAESQSIITKSFSSYEDHEERISFVCVSLRIVPIFLFVNSVANFLFWVVKNSFTDISLGLCTQKTTYISGAIDILYLLVIFCFIFLYISLNNSSKKTSKFLYSSFSFII